MALFGFGKREGELITKEVGWLKYTRCFVRTRHKQAMIWAGMVRPNIKVIGCPVTESWPSRIDSSGQNKTLHTMAAHLFDVTFPL